MILVNFVHSPFFSHAAKQRTYCPEFVYRMCWNHGGTGNQIRRRNRAQVLTLPVVLRTYCKNVGQISESAVFADSEICPT